MKIGPSEFNRKVILRAYDYVQGDSGGSSPVLKESVEVWAKVVSKSGVTLVNQAQATWNYDFEITIRFQSRFNLNWVVDYETQRLVINDISADAEGYKRFMILKCSTKGKIESWS